MVNVFQIAAKIGGDAGPPLNNNTTPDGFPFTAQKRQLEDAGMVTVKWIDVNVHHLCTARLMEASGADCILCAVLTSHYCTCLSLSSPDRWTGEQEAGCTEWLGFNQSTVWVHPAIWFFVVFITHRWQYLIQTSRCTVYLFQKFAPLPLSISKSVIQNLSLALFSHLLFLSVAVPSQLLVHS